MELWDQDAIDLAERGFIDIGRDGVGSLSDDGQLRGRIFFHLGDDSWFTARRFDQQPTG